MPQGHVWFIVTNNVPLLQRSSRVTLSPNLDLQFFNCKTKNEPKCQVELSWSICNVGNGIHYSL